eukprot:2324708-Pleurochrysis_carterae.AAC.3
MVRGREMPIHGNARHVGSGTCKQGQDSIDRDGRLAVVSCRGAKEGRQRRIALKGPGDTTRCIGEVDHKGARCNGQIVLNDQACSVRVGRGKDGSIGARHEQHRMQHNERDDEGVAGVCHNERQHKHTAEPSTNARGPERAQSWLIRRWCFVVCRCTLTLLLLLVLLHGRLKGGRLWRNDNVQQPKRKRK